MKSFLRRGIDRGWLWLMPVLLAIAWLHAFVLHKLSTADDPFFSRALDRQSLFDYLAFRYMHWTGRIPIEAVTVSVINAMPLWRVLNALLLILLCHCVGRIGFGRRQPAPKAIAWSFVLLLLVPPDTLWQAAWWVTGSFNYLWPVALGAFAALPWFDDRKRGLWRYALHGLAGCYAVYNEQAGFALLSLLLPILFATRRKPHWHRSALWLAAMAGNWLLALTAPGVEHRYELEHRWFANFDALGAFDKTSIALGLIKHFMLEPTNLLVLLLALCVIPAANALRGNHAAKAARWLLLSGLAFVVLGFIVAWCVQDGSRWDAVFRIDGINALQAAYPKVYLIMAIATFAIGCLTVATMLVFRDRPLQSLYVAWAFVVALASIAILGWSPTAYASGQRINFVAAVILLAVTCRVLDIQQERFGPRLLRMAMIVSGGIAAWRMWQLLTS